MRDLFTSADLVLVGIAADVAGAVILGLSFSAKKPEHMRAEVPLAIGGMNLDPDFGSYPFPQALLDSLIRQRGEARLGLVLLVGGFMLQAVYVFVGGGGVDSTSGNGRGHSPHGHRVGPRVHRNEDLCPVR